MVNGIVFVLIGLLFIFRPAGMLPSRSAERV